MRCGEYFSGCFLDLSNEKAETEPEPGQSPNRSPDKAENKEHTRFHRGMTKGRGDPPPTLDLRISNSRSLPVPVSPAHESPLRAERCPHLTLFLSSSLVLPCSEPCPLSLRSTRAPGLC